MLLYERFLLPKNIHFICIRRFPKVLEYILIMIMAVSEERAPQKDGTIAKAPLQRATTQAGG